MRYKVNSTKLVGAFVGGGDLRTKLARASSLIVVLVGVLIGIDL